MIRRPPRSTRVRSSAASDVYKRQHATAAQTAADTKNDNSTATAGATPPATAGGAASPSGTTTAPKSNAVDIKGANIPGVKESADAELARWLQIARG